MSLAWTVSRVCGGATGLWPTALVAVISVMGGCGSSGGVTDGGVGDAGRGGESRVGPPEVPWLDEGGPPIAIAPCPDGWREVEGEDGVTTCDPYPEGGPLECAAGQAHFPGEPGCTPVGSACPSGDFAEGLPVDVNVVYVRPGAGGGDGSESAPYGGLGEFALGALPAASVIALSRGMHEGPVRISRGHVLHGACAAATFVRALDRNESEGVVTLVGAGGAVRDLSLADSPRAGVWVRGEGVSGQLDGLIITGVEGIAGIVAAASQLSARTLVVRDTSARASDGAFGRGVLAELAATVEVSRAIIERNRDVGVSAGQVDTVLTLTDVVVRDTQSRATDLSGGRGLIVHFGAAANVSRALLSSNHDVGVFVSDVGSEATLADVVVRDTRSEPIDDTGGRGMGVQLGATVEASRAVFSGNRDIGVYVSEADTAVTLADAIICDTASDASDGSGGRGLNLQNGSSADVSRTLILRNRDIGVLASGMGTVATFADVVVADTETEESDGTNGRGLSVQLGATADVSRALFRRNHDVGVMATVTGTVLTITDVVVQDTDSRDSDGTGGRGLSFELGATADVSRALVSGNREYGVGVLRGGDVALEHLVVSGTQPRACSETTCVGAGGGHGIGSYERGSALRMTHFAVRDSTLCGVHVASGSDLDLGDGEVSGSSIGACVQSTGFDTARLTTDVRYLDNDTNLQATSLPVPDPAEPAIEP